MGALLCGPLYASSPFTLFLVLGSIHLVSAVAASVLMLPTERRLRPARAAAPAKPVVAAPAVATPAVRCEPEAA